MNYSLWQAIGQGSRHDASGSLQWDNLKEKENV
jgi:hypothetical protein